MREHSQERVCGRSRGHQAGLHPRSSDVCITGGKSTLKTAFVRVRFRTDQDHGTQNPSRILGGSSVVPT